MLPRSFHVGSGARNPAAFSIAIAAARAAFDIGLSYGFDMRLLDLGGGFSAGAISAGGDVDLGGVPAAVNGALESHFPESCGVRIIAEPGRCAAKEHLSGCLGRVQSPSQHGKDC